MELSEFLVEAKRNGHISKESVYDKYVILEDNSREFIFNKEDYTYRDRYIGFKSFAGEEIVFLKQKPIWTMNYCGGIKDAAANSDEVYAFLESAIREVPAKAPFRGPRFFAHGRFIYINHMEGNIERFNGTEFILFHGRRIYELNYHGGIINNSRL